jgi:hypothetical protein
MNCKTPTLFIIKKTKTFVLLILLFVTQTNSVQSTFEKWPAIKNFHEVISQTFRPSEEANLNPIKARSRELAYAAKALSTEAIPAEFKTDKAPASIKKLKRMTARLDKIVKEKGADADINKSLIATHDEFHNIVGHCSETK